MACNTCTKQFTLLRKEKGCPGCGFSFCSSCLDNKVFLPKLDMKAKVCAKCKNQLATDSNKSKQVEPPDAYYKRLGTLSDSNDANQASGVTPVTNTKDQEILMRLNKLKEDKVVPKGTAEEIAERLQRIKGDVPLTSNTEIQERLAKLRGVPTSSLQSKTILPTADLRTEQEQVDDMMKQYAEQAKIDNKYQDDFEQVVHSIGARLQKLKGTTGATDMEPSNTEDKEPEDVEEMVKKIVERAKAEASLEEDEIAPSTNDELPFCEICNEDATMRCLGCRYLFCKRCFMEHKDDDDGCNKYEPYKPPRGVQY